MERFKNIAVLLGESREDDRILKRAIELAEHNRAALSVYAMFDKASIVPDMDTVLYPPGDILHRVKRAKVQRLEALTTSFREDGVSISGKVLTGKPFIRVIQEVLKNGHDLLMLPPEKEKLSTSLFFGGTPMHLLRKCPCAVWVFRAQRRRKFRKIMAAVDVATRRKEGRKLNIKIMELAASLAQQEQAELHVAHCWTAFAESILVNMGGLEGEDRRRYMRETKASHLRLLQTFLRYLPVDRNEMHIHLPKGEASVLIPDLVARQGIELLVMGTVARSGIPGLFIGNTAEEILNLVPCSVLAVKPDGFVSPVQPDRP